MAQDLFIIALLTGFFLEKGRFLTQDIFVLGAALLAFLLGVGDHLGAQLLRQGLSVAGLILLAGWWTVQGQGALVAGLFGALVILYLLGRLARTFWSAVAGVALLAAIYWIVGR